MATLTKDNRTGAFLIQWYEGKQRRTLSLSGKKFRQKTAETVKETVETLVYYRRNGILVPDNTLAKRIELADPEIQAKLAKAGLIAVTKQRTCQELWDACLKYKIDIKPSTVTHYLQSKRIFFETEYVFDGLTMKFSLAEPIENVTPDRLLEWKTSLLKQYAKASVASYLSKAQAVFNWAVDQGWLTKSPMANIPKGSYRNRDNDQIISMEEYAKLLDASPNQEWRTIIALARIGGLRCPSELKRLRWSDMNWAENRFLVRSTKTERHEGKAERMVPLFPELRTVLDQHFFSLDETEENEFVIKRFQRSSWTLGKPFKAIAHRAGLVIVRPFDNMRMTRSNEVESRWGARLESLWIGHSEKTMKKFYAMATDEDFASALTVTDGQKSHAKTHAILDIAGCQQ